MNDTVVDLHHEIGLFRYGLIADLVHLPPGTKGLYRRLEEKAAREYTIPGTSRTRVAAETLRDWLKRYRKGGFDALLPKGRADRGQSRALPPAVVERLLAIKEANLALSVRLVIQAARACDEVPDELPLPPSSVHRLLASHGLMRKDPDAPTEQDRRRFAFARAGQLWMSDVMHGPAVPVSGRARRKTYLIGFLDDATRVVPHATFAHSENTRAFLPVLKQSILRRGFPERLYVDNGAAYRSHHLALVCAKLGVALIHARPYRPQGKGKIERFFRSVRAQLLTRLTPEDTGSVEALNRRLACLGRRRIPPNSPPRSRRADTAGALGTNRRSSAFSRAHPRSGRSVLVRGHAQGAEGPHREPRRGCLRGRCRPGGGTGDAALRSRRRPGTPRAGVPRGTADPGGQTRRSVCQLLRQTQSPRAHPHPRRPATAASPLGAEAA